MAFRKNGWTSWAAGIATALAVRTADAQIYSQLPPQSTPAGNQQPAYPQYSNQQVPGPGYQQPQNMAPQNGLPQYQGQQRPGSPNSQYQAPPSTRFQSPQGQYGAPAQSQAPAGINPATQYQLQPGAYPQYPNQAGANPQYQAPANSYGGQPNGYGAQPNGYGAQPARQPNMAPSQRMQQAPGVASYPEAYRAPVAGRGGVRPAQFEQPIDQQQPGAAPPPAEQPAGPNDPPGFRATEVSTASSLPNTVPAAAAGEQTPQEHPLMPALRWAKQGLSEFTKVQDYSCTLVKRERIDGTLGEHEYIFVKVRHQPFSVYTYFLGPARVKGQEAIYVDGSNDGSLLAHGNGIKHRLIGTVSLKPTSTLAMSGNRYPITEMGMRRLLERLLEIGSNDVKYGGMHGELDPRGKGEQPHLHLHPGHAPGAPSQLPLPPGPHLR